MAPKTMFVQQEGCPANALAINRDATQVVIAGRSVFKIFSIEEDEFVEKMNLRVGKNVNLNYSCADVVWNPIEDNILATAATNGAVVTWNLEKISRCKQDMVFQQHKRTVNKVSFHPTESHLLISGSQDGTMKLFDLRRKDVASTFNSNAESVRDVQFNPHQHSCFAAVQENGSVQIWDMRRTDKYERQFTAHNGPVFTLDWHPEERSWLATAGRDKTIKVWDLSSGTKLDQQSLISTIASVVRLRWRPHRRHHIASCCLVVDSSVNIWDIRRPFIPYASFDEHKDVPTGIAWRNGPDAFLSTSKDATLYLHAFSDARRPLERANTVAVDLNSRGDIAFAAWERLLNDTSSNGNVGNRQSNASSKLQGFFRRQPNINDQFPSALSMCMIFQDKSDQFLSMDWLIESAKRYRLTGRSIADICDHNAQVALELSRYDIHKTWCTLKLLYGLNLDDDASSDPTNLLLAEVSAVVDPQLASRHQSGEGVRSVTSRHVSGDPSVERHPGDISAGITDDDTETDDTDHERRVTQYPHGVNFQVPNYVDYFFGDSEGNSYAPFFYEEPAPIDNGDAADDWSIPNEAFQPRHEIRAQSPPVEQLCISNFASSSSALPINYKNTASGHNQRSSEVKIEKDETVDLLSNLLTALKVVEVPMWDSTKTVINMLNHYADLGDVQMSVSVLIVLGDRIKGVIDDATQEQWYTSYIDLLTRYKLWSVANEVTKLSPIHNVNIMNQQSTTYLTGCGNCGRDLHRAAWYCQKCNLFPGKCSVCHKVVKGLYVWCQGCCHGGHLNHMKEWMEENMWCPTGCGHKCEYT